MAMDRYSAFTITAPSSVSTLSLNTLHLYVGVVHPCSLVTASTMFSTLDLLGSDPTDLKRSVRCKIKVEDVRATTVTLSVVATNGTGLQTFNQLISVHTDGKCNAMVLMRITGVIYKRVASLFYHPKFDERWPSHLCSRSWSLVRLGSVAIGLAFHTHYTTRSNDIVAELGSFTNRGCQWTLKLPGQPDGYLMLDASEPPNLALQILPPGLKRRHAAIKCPPGLIYRARDPPIWECESISVLDDLLRQLWREVVLILC
jgi:hypothetical protein